MGDPAQKGVFCATSLEEFRQGCPFMSAKSTNFVQKFRLCILFTKLKQSNNINNTMICK